METWTITGEDRHAEVSKQLRIWRVLEDDASGTGKSHLKDWEIARASGVNPKKVNCTLREMEEAGLIRRKSVFIDVPLWHQGEWASKERTIYLYFGKARAVMGL